MGWNHPPERLRSSQISTSTSPGLPSTEFEAAVDDVIPDVTVDAPPLPAAALELEHSAWSSRPSAGKAP